MSKIQVQELPFRTSVFYLDFSRTNNQIALVNSKDPFCMAAIIKGKVPTLLTGSRVSPESSLSHKFYLFPGKDWIIKESILIHNDLFNVIGIPPIDIDLAQ